MEISLRLEISVNLPTSNANVFKSVSLPKKLPNEANAPEKKA